MTENKPVEKKDTTSGELAICIFAALIISASTTLLVVDRIWMVKAVEHKAAHWIVYTDGRTSFKWNDE